MDEKNKISYENKNQKKIVRVQSVEKKMYIYIHSILSAKFVSLLQVCVLLGARSYLSLFFFFSLFFFHFIFAVHIIGGNMRYTRSKLNDAVAGFRLQTILSTTKILQQIERKMLYLPEILVRFTYEANFMNNNHELKEKKRNEKKRH